VKPAAGSCSCSEMRDRDVVRLTLGPDSGLGQKSSGELCPPSTHTGSDRRVAVDVSLGPHRCQRPQGVGERPEALVGGGLCGGVMGGEGTLPSNSGWKAGRDRWVTLGGFPRAWGGRDWRWLERFAKVGEDLPDRSGLRDEGDQPDIPGQTQFHRWNCVLPAPISSRSWRTSRDNSSRDMSGSLATAPGGVAGARPSSR
jgi:hypothetical protein